MMTKFLTIVVVLRRVEDLLEYNVDPISDSENLDLAPIWKPKLFLQSLYNRSLVFSTPPGTGTRKCIWISFDQSQTLESLISTFSFLSSWLLAPPPPSKLFLTRVQPLSVWPSEAPIVSASARLSQALATSCTAPWYHQFRTTLILSTPGITDINCNDDQRAGLISFYQILFAPRPCLYWPIY